MNILTDIPINIVNYNLDYNYKLDEYYTICKQYICSQNICEQNIIHFISNYINMLSHQEHTYKNINYVSHLNNIYDLYNLYNKLYIINKLNNTDIYLIFIEILCKTINTQHILKKCNLDILEEYNIINLMIKTSMEGSLPILLILIQYIHKKNYNIDNHTKETCIINSFKNTDDRVYKYYLTNVSDIIYIINNNMNLIISNIFSFYIPDKYKLRRLKMLNSIVPLDNMINHMILSLNDNITNSSSHNNYYMACNIFKYYYNYENIDVDNIIKLAHICVYVNIDNIDNIDIYINKVYNFYNILQKNIDKNIFLCEYIINVDYIYYKYINLQIIPDIDMKDYNIADKIINNNFIQLTHNPIIHNIFKLFKNSSSILYSISYNSKSIIYLLPFVNYFQSNNYMTHIEAIRLNKCIYYIKVFIRKYNKNKTIYRRLKIKPLLDEMINLKPNESIKVLKDGTRFHSNMMQKFNNIPPYHIFPGQLNLLNNFLIRQKADGVLSTNIPNIIYPIFNFKQNIKAEYIEDMDLYLVYDIDINSNIIDRYNHLRSLHHSTHNSSLKKITSQQELEDSIKNEEDILNKFLDEPYEHYRWYPKAAWEIGEVKKNIIENMIDILNLLKPIEIISSKYIIPTDGYIISPLNGNREIKIKPKYLLTIDLLYKNNKWYDRDGYLYNNIQFPKDSCNKNIIPNSIWRCYPLSDLTYDAREIRLDKIKPNTRMVVNNIISLYKINYKKYYPSIYNFKLMHFNKDTYWENIININTSVIKKMLKKLPCKNIIDLGGGNGKILKYLNNYKMYHCIDMDVNMLARGVNKYIGKQNIFFNNIDLSGEWNKQDYWYNIIGDMIYDTVIAINSLQHFNTDIFWTQLNNITQKNTYMLFNLVTMDDNTRYNFGINQDSYIERNNLNIIYYFDNIHIQKMNEEYIDNIYDIIEKNGWKIIEKYIPTTDLLPKYYTWYIAIKI